MRTPRNAPRRQRALRSVAVAGLALSLVAGAAACGDDDEKAEGITTTTGEIADPTVDTPRDDPDAIPGVDGPAYVANPDPTVDDAACDAWTAGMGAIHQAPQEPGAELTSYFEEEVLPHTLELIDTVDSDRTAHARTVHDSLSQMGSSGDFSVLESPAYTEAQAALGLALHVGCDWAAVTIQADEYEFEQVPGRLAAGRYSFALENVGVEEHEMVLFRRNDGVTESFEELAELGDEMMEKLTFTGVAFGGPGTTSYSAVDLEPGTYFLVCFIPVGGGEDGPPHFMEGMVETIEVS
jgi:predicted heme/steroid binding protein